MVYDISYKTLIDAKPLPIRFNNVDGITRVYDGIRYLVFTIPIFQVFFANIEKKSIFGGRLSTRQ